MYTLPESKNCRIVHFQPIAFLNSSRFSFNDDFVKSQLCFWQFYRAEVLDKYKYICDLASYLLEHILSDDSDGDEKVDGFRFCDNSDVKKYEWE